ncbi:hypothetical protein [Nocardia sp. NBC_00511]|uniref:hypothetical protein n=1 Tax=Nocardia sp. NBC_00511 TaxID=2903591 RepID=UPI0030E28CB2
MKFGKLPARINATTLKLATYLDSTVLPKVPAEFGHEKAIADYGMLGNDEVADCLWAGAGHETMIWGREANTDIEFTEQSVLSDYSAVTGYNPLDPESDKGTDMQAAASYRRRIGVLDAAGTRHRVGAYVALTPGDPDELAAASYIFGAVGIGLRVPAYAEAEFNANQPWDVRHGNSQIVGGHYVPVVGRRAGQFCVVTWGRVQEMTVGFYRRYCDEALVYLSTEMLTSGISPEGFNLAALQADLQAFTRR